MDRALGRQSLSAPLVLGLLAVLTGVGVVLFMTVGAKGSWSFVLSFRGAKVATMAVVAVATGAATVVFQTIAANRILTPSLMGFDSLYGLIQTVLVAGLGASLVAGIPVEGRFFVEAGIMSAFAILLYHWLFFSDVRGLHLLMLVGLVCGILFKSLTSFLKRIMDPNAFITIQDRLFASFNRPDLHLLTVSALVVGGIVVVGWRWLPTLDVLALGRERSINLGVAYRRMVMGCLLTVSLLTAVSTALVGPMMFLGLLVANLAYLIIPSHRHVILVPAAILIALSCLLYGQLVLERLFAFETALGMIIEFVGGLVFLFLLVRGLAR